MHFRIQLVFCNVRFQHTKLQLLFQLVNLALNNAWLARQIAQLVLFVIPIFICTTKNALPIALLECLRALLKEYVGLVHHIAFSANK